MPVRTDPSSVGARGRYPCPRVTRTANRLAVAVEGEDCQRNYRTDR